MTHINPFTKRVYDLPPANAGGICLADVVGCIDFGGRLVKQLRLVNLVLVLLVSDVSSDQILVQTNR